MTDNKLEDEIFGDLDERNNEALRKQKELNIRRTEDQYSNMEERDKIAEIHSKIDVSIGNKKNVVKVQGDLLSYFDSLKLACAFLNNDFKGYVPFGPHEVILIPANTGDGKSTTAANLAYHTLIQKKTILSITNEERVPDVFNRVTCLVKKWSYINHYNFSQVQIETFKEYVDILSERMSVIDNDYAGVPGQTTTIEGIEAIFKGLLKRWVENKEYYDVIVLDYYQNIALSSKNPKLEPWQVQERFCRLLDEYRKLIPSAFVILAQKNPNLKGDTSNVSYKQLIEGRKMISNVATVVLEATKDAENFRTVWTVRKSRFSQGVGHEIYTGFDKGKYVPYTKSFKDDALKRKEEMSLNRAIGVKTD